jgi:5'-3' exonuclease
MYRAKHTTGLALPKTGIIFGFFKQLHTIVEKVGGFHNIAFCFDSKKSFRKKRVATYKANRNQEPPTKFDLDCFSQFAQLRNIIIPKLFKNSFVFAGYEADDLIASVVKNNKESFKVVTNDEDIYQLLDYTSIINPKTYIETTKETFLKDTGLSNCSDWIEIKAISGCTSDHVIGIHGVGEAKAIQYLTRTGTETMKTKIESFINTEEYNINKWLVTLPLQGTPKIRLKPYQAPTIEKFVSFCDYFKIRSFPLSSWNHLFKMK